MGIEYHSVTLLAKDLGGIPIELRRELRPKLLEAGQIVARQAQSNASWSTRIPGAIKVRASFALKGGGVKVSVDRTKAPHARPLEGIASRKGVLSQNRAGTFRHPVFGTDTWVDQPTRPFLAPAAVATRGDAADRVAEAVRSATRHLTRSVL